MNATTVNDTPQFSHFDDVDANLDGDLLALGARELDLLTETRRALNLAQEQAADRPALMCQAFLLGKGARVTRAMLTLVRHGQGNEAVGLLREQHEFVTALLYYQKHQDAAALFIASHPIEQLRMAKRNLATGVSKKEKAKRRALLLPLQADVHAAVKKYPSLEEGCGKNCKRKSKHRHFRRLPDHLTMLRDLLVDWLAAAYAHAGTPISKKDLNRNADLLTAREHLTHAHFISQDKHGLPFVLTNNLSIDQRTLQIGEVNYQAKTPNELLYHIVGSATPFICDTVDVNNLTDLRPAVEAWKTSLEHCKHGLGITDGNPALTRLRVV